MQDRSNELDFPYYEQPVLVLEFMSLLEDHSINKATALLAIEAASGSQGKFDDPKFRKLLNSSGFKLDTCLEKFRSVLREHGAGSGVDNWRLTDLIINKKYNIYPPPSANSDDWDVIRKIILDHPWPCIIGAKHIGLIKDASQFVKSVKNRTVMCMDHHDFTHNGYLGYKSALAVIRHVLGRSGSLSSHIIDGLLIYNRFRKHVENGEWSEEAVKSYWEKLGGGFLPDDYIEPLINELKAHPEIPQDEIAKTWVGVDSSAILEHQFRIFVGFCLMRWRDFPLPDDMREKRSKKPDFIFTV